MTNFEISSPEINYSFPMVFVKGTEGDAYLFGDDDMKLDIHLDDFFISKYLVTQKLWEYVMADNPSTAKGSDKPVETVSYDRIKSGNGFLQKLNGLHEVSGSIPTG